MAVPKDSSRQRFSNTLRKDLYKGLQECNKQTDIPISKLLDRAVMLLFKEIDFNPEESDDN